MPQTEVYGAFGDLSVEVDDDGFIEIPVIVEESGLFFGAAPPELRIHSTGSPRQAETIRRMVAKLNRKTDLPFFLATAKIKIVSPLEKVTDEMIIAEGLEPIPDR